MLTIKGAIDRRMIPDNIIQTDIAYYAYANLHQMPPGDSQR